MNKSSFLYFLLCFSFLLGCEKQDSEAAQKEKQEKIMESRIKNHQESASGFTPLPLSYSYEDLDSFVGSKVTLEGQLTGERFSHEVFFHPPYSELAHFNLNPSYQFADRMPHLVIYFKKENFSDETYLKFMDKNAVVSGVLGKVEGSLLNPDPEKVKSRKAHTEYFIDIETLELAE